jgi:opacity protein-like surface antigen
MSIYTPLLILILLSPAVADAYEGEWQASIVGALELPGLQSQSPTDFDLATWSTGVQVGYGLFDWLHWGGRLVHSQVDGVIEDYTSTSRAGTDLTGDLSVDLSAWRTEAFMQLRLINGLSALPRLTLAGGYTWTIYADPKLALDAGEIEVEQTDDFAQGTFTATATLDIAWRILPFLELSVGAELSHYFDGLYTNALRFPISATGVFWGPL